MHQLPKPMLFIPNYSLDHALNDPAVAQLLANVDAVLDEQAAGNYGYYTTDADWLDRIQLTETVQQSGKAYYSISGFSPLDNNAIQWGLASYLMGKEHAAAIFLGESSLYGSDAWLSEYTAALGHACGAMAATQNVYVRSFAQGLSVANPSSSSTAQYTLPAGQYTDLYGHAAAGSVTLGPHSGIVLLLVGAPHC
jgi:hypothetical protein